MCYIYILASQRNGNLYVGVTSDLIKRIWQHKNDVCEGFTKEYQVKRLVYFEQFENVNDAIRREKHIKHWNRKWKLELIEKIIPIGMIYMATFVNKQKFWIPVFTGMTSVG